MRFYWQNPFLPLENEPQGCQVSPIPQCQGLGELSWRGNSSSSTNQHGREGSVLGTGEELGPLGAPVELWGFASLRILPPSPGWLLAVFSQQGNDFANQGRGKTSISESLQCRGRSFPFQCKQNPPAVLRKRGFVFPAQKSGELSLPLPETLPRSKEISGWVRCHHRVPDPPALSGHSLPRGCSHHPLRVPDPEPPKSGGFGSFWDRSHGAAPPAAPLPWSAVPVTL